MDWATYFIICILITIVCSVIRVVCVIMCRNMTAEPPPPRVPGRVLRRIRIDPPNSSATNIDDDRQGNVFAIHDETSRERRYDDIFFIEPNSVEAARIRAQLEKDEKDLPSYDEVMRMANLNSPTAAPATSAFDTVAAAPGGAVSINASSSSVNTTETTLTVPPYVEVDMSATSNSTRSVTPPPYSPPTAALPAIIPAAVVLPIAASAQTQQTSSNV